MLNATVTAQSRLQTPEQFGDIVIKTLPDGSAVRVKDVARVEIGAESYNINLMMNGHPGAGMAISLSPGADALETADLVKAKMQELARTLPDGLSYAYANDASAFIRLSVSEVEKSLLEAIAAGGHRDVRVPAELARAAGAGDRRAGGAAGHLRGVLSRGLYHQHHDPVRHGAGDRPAGR